MEEYLSEKLVYYTDNIVTMNYLNVTARISLNEFINN
jgi:hypothetical protein